MLPGMELMSCPNLAVPREVMHHVVRVESSYNPYAIGVVGGRLVRQPRNLPEALSTVRMLEQRGYNFSIGLAQVNRYNLAKYGLQSYEQAFQPCANLVAGSRILRECYGRSGGDWGKSFSCYYSGDFRTGYRHGYVQKVYASIRQGRAGAAAAMPDVAPIAVVDRAQRRVAASPSLPAAPQSSVSGLVERRAGAVRPEPRPQVAALAPSYPEAAAAGVQAQPAIATVPQAGPPAAVQPTMAQFAAAAPPQPATAPPTGPVRVSATRLGQPSRPAAQAAQASGGDNAFVF